MKRKLYGGIAKTNLPSNKYEAEDLELVHFYTGRPCIRGHRVPRYTNNGSCVECVKLAVREWQRKNKRGK